MSSLRHIAVTVEESGRNQYSWVLTETTGGHSAVLQKGEPCHSYMAALDAGRETLAQLLSPPEPHDAL